MSFPGAGSPPGWLLLALLILALPLIQGGAPRLPALGLELGVFALTISWAWSWARAPRRELRLSALDAHLGFLLFWALFSVPFAPYYHAAEGAAVMIASHLLLYGYLVCHPSLSGLSLALGAVRLQAAFQSLLVLWQAAGPAGLRPPGTFYNPNFLAGFLAAALALVAGRLIFPPAGAPPRPWVRAASALEAALLFAALLLTGSRGGTLALAAGLLVLVGLRSWRVAAAAALTAAAALVAIPNPLIHRLTTLDADVFAWTRFEIWKSALAMMLDHPWLGIGLGQFELVSPRYAFPVKTHWAKYTHVAENAHSEYLQAGAELGIPGLAIALGVVALLLIAAARRLRALAPRERGPVAALLAGIVSIATHAAVDFPLHTPPASLLLVLFGAGLRVHGAHGFDRPVSFRVRPVYAAAVASVALLLSAAAVRPVVGFWYFLGALGAPRDLFHEKWALEIAPRTPPAPSEAARLLGRAVRVDFVNAPYHRALGSVLFQSYLRGDAGQEVLHQALYHLAYAAELNPNQYLYEVNSAQAMVSLARRAPPGRERLEEALRHLRRAVELAPYQYQVHAEMGRVANELGDVAAAEAAFRRAVALEEYFLRGWADLGTFYARHGRFAEARQALGRGAALAEKAASLVPTSEGERELIAVKPDFFYNELKKIEAIEHPEVTPS